MCRQNTTDSISQGHRTVSSSENHSSFLATVVCGGFLSLFPLKLSFCKATPPSFGGKANRPPDRNITFPCSGGGSQSFDPLIPRRRSLPWLRQHAEPPLGTLLSRAASTKFYLYRGKSCLPPGSAELHACFFTHAFDSRQRFHAHAHAADQLPAGLKRLFHADTGSHQ